MNREEISRIAHTGHPIAAPLDDGAVRLLLDSALPAGGRGRLLDLGCGGGEWLLRALSAHPQLRAEGVDVSAAALARARQAAARAGVGDRLVLHHGDAAGFAPGGAFDLVLCVGATHAFGGLLPTLAAAREHLAPGGRVLVGDGFWDGEPSAEAVAVLGELEDLPTTLDRIAADGWVPVQGHISSRAELDAYEWSWTGSLAAWALDHPEDPDSTRALEAAAAHRTEWLRGYRDVFGFVSLVLRPVGD
ncbi:class I SAM-dependent methyltransferase [Streptomyces bambusae]|uniref:SAM-dependent methyltransferase n=1 Tax=Streptomyces bambusae TaxID=1550616 RepID=UPI001CFF2027|nr:class I SAM-dependent methyltransferase [Streptomyces bambusae]MCB5167529.1 class I SAM-dependent methyltransferase [Streptomyces bambusae]